MITTVALTIAGSDSGGGAGIQADLKTFAAFGVHGTSALTALTAQNTCAVRAVFAVSPAFVEAQCAAVLEDFNIGAIKTGMLANTATLEVVARVLAGVPAVPLVVDPVMVATSGDALLTEDAVEVLREKLIPRADILTPNLFEAAKLLAVPVATTRAAMEAQGAALIALGARAVLLKGGHGAGETRAADVLVRPGALPRWFEGAWVETPNTHGTGCTLSAAIASGLAKGATLEEAVSVAKRFLGAALEAGRTRRVGKGQGGHGPAFFSDALSGYKGS